MIESELLSTLQAISSIAGATGVCIAAFYYMMTLRNTEKIRRKDIIFQSHTPRSVDYYSIYYEVVYHHLINCKTIEDYWKISEDVRVKHNYLYMHFNTIGLLLRDGMASVDEIFQLYPPMAIIQLWEVTELFVNYMRVSSDNVDYLKPFELLYREARKKSPNFVVYWKQPSFSSNT